jgi:hypothetical protein
MTSRDDRKSVKKKAMATAKEAQHDAAESPFGHIIAQHTLTPEIVEELARAYAAVAVPGVADYPRLGA